MSVLLTTATALAFKASVGIGIVFVLWRLFGRAPAHLRHALLASALVSALLMPLLALLTPVIAIPVLPAVLSTAMPQPAVTAGAAIPAVATVTGASLTALVFSMYLAVIGVLLLRHGIALLRLRALELGPADESLHARLQLYRDSFPRTRPVRLLEGPGISTPMTWGFFRPVLVLPAGARHWSDQRIDEALIHELAHIRRGDWMVQRLADLCCAAYWFLPPVWYMARHLRMEAEHACDDVVLNRFGSRADYAAHLVELARSQRSNYFFPAVAMATVSPLSRRVNAILDTRQRRNTMRPRATCAVFCLPLGLFIALAAIQATASEAPVPRADESSVSAHAAPAPKSAPAAPASPAAPAADRDAVAPDPVIARARQSAPAAPASPAAPAADRDAAAPMPPAQLAPNSEEVSPAPAAPEVAGRVTRDMRVAQRELGQVERETLELERALRDEQREANRVAGDREHATRDEQREAKRAERDMQHAARDMERAEHDERRLESRELAAAHFERRAVMVRERDLARGLRDEQRALREQEQELRRAEARTQRSLEAENESVD